MDIKVSLFASSIRTNLYHSFFKTLANTSVEYEVVFAGNARFCDVIPLKDKYGFTYIQTADIKPAQCYEIARRQCKGEVVVWVADDCEFYGDVIGQAYNAYKQLKNEKAILSIQTMEDGRMCNMLHHSFFGANPETPRMAPLGMINREFLNELGGLDQRYLCGQYENDIVMRAYQYGAKLYIFGNKDAFIKIDHLAKHGRETRFWGGYDHDREILENSWVHGGYQGKQKGAAPIIDRVISKKRIDLVERFDENEDWLYKSQGPKGIWV